MLVGAVASKGLFDNWDTKKSATDLSLSVIQTEDFVEGYIDGLMNIYIKGQLEDCQEWIPDIKEHLQTAVDDLDRCNDKWISFKEKKKLGMDALSQVMKLTPDVIADIKDTCPLGDNLDQIIKWEAQYWNPSKVAALMARNYFSHVLKMVGMSSESFQAFKDEDFYQFGEDIGEMIRFLITPDGEDQEEE